MDSGVVIVPRKFHVRARWPRRLRVAYCGLQLCQGDADARKGREVPQRQGRQDRQERYQNGEEIYIAFFVYFSSDCGLF